jgi:hypothetical protein
MLVLNFGLKERINHLAFRPDGRAVVATSKNFARYWPDVCDGARAEQLQSLDWANHIAFTEEGKTVFFGAYRALWRVDLATRKGVALRTPASWPEFDVSPDGRFVLVEEPGECVLALYPAENLDSGAAIWKQKVRNHTRPYFIENSTRFIRLEGKRDGRDDITIVTYDSANGHQLAQSPPLADWLVNAVAAPDGRWFVGHIDSWLYYCPITADVGTARRIKNDNRSHFTDVAFHPSSKYIAATSNDTTVKFFDTTNWELAHVFSWKSGRMRSIVFSPDGTLAAAGSDKGQVVVWDVDL